MRCTERRQLLRCTHFTVLSSRHTPHTCCTCRPIRVNRRYPMHNAHVVCRARDIGGGKLPGRCPRRQLCKQPSRSGDHDGIIRGTALTAEERWTCPSSPGTGNGVHTFIVRVTAMPIYVL